MLAIIDYGVGNLFSLRSSFAAIGTQAVVTGDPEIIRGADKLILPGVGAFEDAAAKLRESGLGEVICTLAGEGKPLMGICLGMQLLFDKSYEYGEHNGLGLISGKVKALKDVVPAEMKIPQMGWNALDMTNEDHQIFKYISNGECVYFVHSYYAADCAQSTIATTEYGGYPVTAAVANGNVVGCQFHPEKSGNTGLNILRAFCEG